jgi:PEP-CTERM motif
MKTTRRAIGSIIVGLVLLIALQSHLDASTSMELSLNDLVNPEIDILDGGPLDSNPLAGVITYNGPIGSWSVNVTTGITYPALGTPNSPMLDLNSVNVSSSGPASLAIGVSALGYTLAPAGATFEIGGTTDGLILAQAASGDVSFYFDSTNQIGNLMTFSSGAFSGSASGSIPAAPNPYSLSIFTDIEHEGAGSTSFNAKLAAVPEPSALIFLGFGLLGLVGVRKKFQR